MLPDNEFGGVAAACGIATCVVGVAFFGKVAGFGDSDLGAEIVTGVVVELLVEPEQLSEVGGVAEIKEKIVIKTEKSTESRPVLLNSISVSKNQLSEIGQLSHPSSRSR